MVQLQLSAQTRAHASHVAWISALLVPLPTLVVGLVVSRMDLLSNHDIWLARHPFVAVVVTLWSPLFVGVVASRTYQRLARRRVEGGTAATVPGIVGRWVIRLLLPIGLCYLAWDVCVWLAPEDDLGLLVALVILPSAALPSLAVGILAGLRVTRA